MHFNKKNNPQKGQTFCQKLMPRFSFKKKPKNAFPYFESQPKKNEQKLVGLSQEPKIQKIAMKKGMSNVVKTCNSAKQKQLGYFEARLDEQRQSKNLRIIKGIKFGKQRHISSLRFSQYFS